MLVPALLVGFPVFAALAEPPAKAPPSKGGEVRVLFIGESGDTPNPSPEAKDYMENGGAEGAKPPPRARLEVPRPKAAPGPIAAPAPPAAEPEAGPERAAAAEPAAHRKTPDAFLRKDPASMRYSERQARRDDAAVPSPELPPPPPAEDRRRYSLWDGLSAPMALPADKIKDAPADQASGLGRQDYDSHILGAPAAARPPDFSPAAPAADKPRGETFVAVGLDLKDMPLRDAVAGLSAASGFRQDPRFEPSISGPGKAAVWGWISPGRLGEAARAPNVERVETDPSASAPAAAVDGPSAELLVGVRVPAGLSVGETFERVSRELSAQARFRVARVVGYQPVPGSKDLAVIALGRAPVGELAHLMQHPAVLKVLPAPPARRPARAKPASEPARFIEYVGERAPLLLLATLLLLLAPIGRRALRLLDVFVPYHR